jgi:Tfp pilus assembly protein PilX
MTRRARSEDGFSMIVVIVALMVASMLTVAAISAATGDLPASRTSQDRKAAYAAAESGLAYFNYKLANDNTYWKTCGDGGSGRVNTRTVPGTAETYTIEFLPVTTNVPCNTTDPEGTMLDSKTGTFRVRSTGRTGNVYRSIVATYRRTGFLDFIWFSGWESTDPLFTGNSEATCAKVRSTRSSSSCPPIQFVTGDALKGPMHTNDEDFLYCGSPVFGNVTAHKIETTGSAIGKSNGCGGSPTVKGTALPNSASIGVPSTNSDILAAANGDGWVFAGRTYLQLNGSTITARDKNGTVLTKDANNVSLSSGWPDNGVIYVKDGGGCTKNVTPDTTDYSTSGSSANESLGCANAWVRGSYAQDLTVAAANDVVVYGDVTRGADVVGGLIADRFVRVFHPVSSSGSCGANSSWNAGWATFSYMQNVTIEAAIMSVKHVFTVDNFDSAPKLGNLTVNGAIAQLFRGAVGTSGGCAGTGYLKDYNWDNRLHFRNPPYFLDPVTAQWGVIKGNEQVPAARPSGL